MSWTVGWPCCGQWLCHHGHCMVLAFWHSHDKNWDDDDQDVGDDGDDEDEDDGWVAHDGWAVRGRLSHGLQLSYCSFSNSCKYSSFPLKVLCPCSTIVLKVLHPFSKASHIFIDLKGMIWHKRILQGIELVLWMFDLWLLGFYAIVLREMILWDIVGYCICIAGVWPQQLCSKRSWEHRSRPWPPLSV